MEVLMQSVGRLENQAWKMGVWGEGGAEPQLKTLREKLGQDTHWFLATSATTGHCPSKLLLQHKCTLNCHQLRA